MSGDSFPGAVDAVISAIESGTVLTYGEVAVEAGYPGAARAVGHHLQRSGGTLPWWRVVAATGRLVPGHETEHASHLRREGVEVTANRVRMTRSSGRRARRPNT